jgi:hypothetical protein
MTDGAATGLAPAERPLTIGDAGTDVANAPERRPGDISWLAVASMGLVLCALWSRASGDANENLCKAINGPSDGLEGLAQAFTFLGFICRRRPERRKVPSSPVATSSVTASTRRSSVVPARVPRGVRRAAHDRADRRGSARERGSATGWHRCTGSRSHGGPHPLRNPDESRARDGAGLPHDHAPHPASLRILAPPSTSRAGNRVMDLSNRTPKKEN